MKIIFEVNDEETIKKIFNILGENEKCDELKKKEAFIPNYPRSITDIPFPPEQWR